MSEQVAIKFGLKSSETVRLINMNDDVKYSFSAIADWIEEYVNGR